MIGVFGRKIGMTQVFRADGRLIPVTVIDTNSWHVVGFKTAERDGYAAILVGLPTKRYQKQAFSEEWLKNVGKHFYFVREIGCQEGQQADVVIGQKIDSATLLQEGQFVHASGVTKGHGFQGVVKRHGFRGGPASHGPRMGRRPGSIGSHRSQGSVDRGKRMPGHMGVDCRSVRNLEIIKIDSENGAVFVKGSMPGFAGSLVFIKKSAS